MNLFDKLSNFLPLKKDTQVAEYFFALNIDTSKVEAVVWGIEGRKLRIVKAAQAEYKNEQDLTNAANYALDDALADFQPEPEKILFGVPDDWLQDENLKPDKLKLLRHMVKELGVSPMAYVSTTAALCHFLQKQQGVPLTSVLVSVAEDLSVSVVKAGKVVATRSQKRSSNLPEDIEKALLTFSEVEVLPAKIIIYGPAIGDYGPAKFKEELLSFPWMSQLPFLHLPKIESLPFDITLKAIILAGGSELNPQVVFPHELLNTSLFGQGKAHHYMPDAAQGHHDKGHEKTVRSLDEEDMEETAVPGHVPAPRHAPVQHQQDEEGEVAPAAQTLPGKLQALVAAPLSMLPFKIGSQHVAHHTGEHQARRGAVPWRAVGLPLAVLALLVGAYIFLSKATVTVFMDMKDLERESQVIADPAVAQVDEQNKKIPGRVIDTSVNGSLSGKATGKKQVGDPAKGKVVVYNATSKAVSLSKGTTLTNDKGQKFVLDTAVQIASKSASAADPPSRSAAADATASEIGPDGNIPAGVDLTVGGYGRSDVVAKVDSAFAGGVSKEVTVVTSDDQKKLLATLTSDLRKKARDELQSKLTGDLKVQEETLKEEIGKQSYSKAAGEQASDFTLNLTVKYNGTAYSENDLKSIVSKLVEINVPEGYSLDPSQTETQADVAKIEKDGRIVFNAKFKAKLTPKLDLEKIKKDIAGKTPVQAANMLKSYENVIGSQIQLNPNIPLSFLQYLPFMSKNITIEITAK